MIQKSAIIFGLAALILSSDAIVMSRSLDSAGVSGGKTLCQSPQDEHQAETFFQEAMRLADQRDTEPARRQMQEAIRIWSELHQPEKAVAAALKIADRYRYRRDYFAAITYYRWAIDLQPTKLTAPTALNRIALIYSDLCAYELAIHCFGRALEQSCALGDVREQTVALGGLTDVYLQQRSLDKAEDCIDRALLLIGERKPDAWLLYLRGLVSKEQEQVASARESFDKALTIYASEADVEGRIKVLCELSSLSLLAGRKQEALEYAEASHALVEEMPKRAALADYANLFSLSWPMFLAHARAERALGRIQIALKSYQSAQNFAEALFLGTYQASETSAVAFREKMLPAYLEYLELLIDEAQYKTAYEVVNKIKARTLLNFAGARIERPHKMAPQQAGSIRELSQLIRSCSEMLASGIKGKERTDAQHKIEEAQFRIEEIGLLYDLGHIIDRQVWSELAEAESLQKKMAEDRMTLAEFELGEKRSYLWLFTDGEMYFQLLPSRQEIENALKPYLYQISAPPNSPYLDRDLKQLTEGSGTLFDMLFGRLSSRIEPGQKLIIVPDGMLNYLPFESLIHNRRYLIEDHEISYSRSASFLLQPHNSMSQPHAADKMELIAFGDPSLEQTMNHTSADAIRYAGTSRALNLPPIPRSRDEVLSIAGLFPPDLTRVYVGRDSSEEVLKRESLRRYRRLHFATHAVVDERTPARSAVVLTPSAGEDGLLQVSEISELDLDCDLVVLSACRTGRGQVVAGEGIIGLARAFLYAGARSVVISLWNVTDISTNHLMNNFYQGLAGHRSTADALRQAKLEMLRRHDTRHPYYWAPFVTIGRP